MVPNKCLSSPALHTAAQSHSSCDALGLLGEPRRRGRARSAASGSDERRRATPHSSSDDARHATDCDARGPEGPGALSAPLAGDAPAVLSGGVLGAAGVAAASGPRAESSVDSSSGVLGAAGAVAVSAPGARPGGHSSRVPQTGAAAAADSAAGTDRAVAASAATSSDRRAAPGSPGAGCLALVSAGRGEPAQPHSRQSCTRRSYLGLAGSIEAPGARTLDARLPLAQALANTQEDAALAAAAHRVQRWLASAHSGPCAARHRTMLISNQQKRKGMPCSWPVCSALSSQRALTNTAWGYKGQARGGSCMTGRQAVHFTHSMWLPCCCKGLETRTDSLTAPPPAAQLLPHARYNQPLHASLPPSGNCRATQCVNRHL